MDKTLHQPARPLQDALEVQPGHQGHGRRLAGLPERHRGLRARRLAAQGHRDPGGERLRQHAARHRGGRRHDAGHRQDQRLRGRGVPDPQGRAARHPRASTSTTTVCPRRRCCASPASRRRATSSRSRPSRSCPSDATAGRPARGPPVLDARRYHGAPRRLTMAHIEIERPDRRVRAARPGQHAHRAVAGLAWPSSRASSSWSWDPAAAARPRSSTPSPACVKPTSGTILVARQAGQPDRDRTAPWSSRSTPCCRGARSWATSSSAWRCSAVARSTRGGDLQSAIDMVGLKGFEKSYPHQLQRWHAPARRSGPGARGRAPGAAHG